MRTGGSSLPGVLRSPAKRATTVVALVFLLCLATSQAALASGGGSTTAPSPQQSRAPLALSASGPVARAAGIGLHCGFTRCAAVWSRRSTYRLQKHVSDIGDGYTLATLLCGGLPPPISIGCGAFVQVHRILVQHTIKKAAGRYQCFALAHDHSQALAAIYPYVEHGDWCHTK